MRFPSRASTAMLAMMAIAALAGAEPAAAQTAGDRPGWRLSLGGSAYQIDDLVGTPFGPSGTLFRTIGRRGFVALEVNGIVHQGFYRADALTGDLDIGVRFPMDRFELTLSGGPSGIAGGDSDGTPYLGGGAQAAVGGTAWVTNSIGLTSKVRARHWWGIVNDVRLGVSFGVVLKL